MRVIISYILLIILFLSGESARAQTAQDARVYITEKEIVFRNDSIQIHLEIKANNIYLLPDQALELEFFLEAENRKQPLPSIVYEGSRFSRADRRKDLLSYEYVASTYHTYKTAQKNTSYSLDYIVGIPYASWMNSAALSLKQSLRDCCSKQQLLESILTDNINVYKKEEKKKEAESDTSKKIQKEIITAPPYKEMVLFLEPEENNKRKYADTKPLKYLEFRSTISYTLEGYGIQHQLNDNTRNLIRIDSLFREIERNPSVKLDKIVITGYTSPEGTYQYNKTLANNRVLEFKSYLSRNYRLSDKVFITSSIGEDWEELRRLVTSAQIQYKDEILSIIDNVGIFNGREKKLMDLDEGNPYKQMAKELFPSLRRIEVKVIYSITHSSANIKQQSPSLQVNDIVANNNAAAIAILMEDTRKARVYMERIKDNPMSHINWGVLNYVEGNIEQAKKYFTKAIQNKDTKDKAELNLRLIDEYEKK